MCFLYRGASFPFLIAPEKKKKKEDKRIFVNIFFPRRELKYFYGAELTGTAGEFDVFNVSKRDTSLAMLETSKVSFDICISIVFLLK